MIRDDSLYEAAKIVKQRFGGRARPNLIDNPGFNRQIRQVAAERGVSPDALKSLLIGSVEFYKTRQDYVSQGATQPVPTGRGTYRAPTEEERGLYQPTEEQIEKYPELARVRGSKAFVEGKVAEIQRRRTPTTAEEFAASLFKRQGVDKKLVRESGVEFVVPRSAKVSGLEAKRMMEERGSAPTKAEPVKYTDLRGEISEYKPKTISERLGWERAKQLSRLDQSGKVIEQVYRGVFVLGVLGVARGAMDAVEFTRHPIRSILSQINMVSHPIQTLTYMGQEFVVDPVGTVARFYTFSKILNLQGKLASRSPVGRYVREELYIRSNPKVLRPYLRSIIKSSKVQERINPFKVRDIPKVDFVEVKSLTRSEAGALLKTLKQTDSVVFGSAASRTLSKRQTAIPKDVDLATRDIGIFYERFKSNLPKKLKNNVILRNQKIIRRSDGNSILDVKPIYRLYPQKIPFFRKGYLPISTTITKLKKTKTGYLPVKKAGVSRILDVPTQRVVDMNGIKMIGFGEQTVRKGLGTIQVLIERNTRRAKDPQSFIIGLRTQLGALKRIKPKNQLNKFLVNRRIKVITDAVKILESKGFQKLLESRVPGILDKYPLIKKIDPIRLKKASVKNIMKSAKNNVKKLTMRDYKYLADNIGLKTSKQLSKLPKSAKKAYSYLPKYPPSYLPRIYAQLSYMPSKLPVKESVMLISKLPSRIPSKLAIMITSKVPSNIPRSSISQLISKTPANTVSKLISILPPSKVPPSKIPPSKIPSSRVPPSKVPPSKIPPGKVYPAPAPLPTYNTKLPAGYRRLINPIVRIRGRNRELNWRTTFNRALRMVIRLIDNTTARSFQLKIVGVTKARDILQPQSLRKFRLRRGKDKRVLIFVEKSKYAIDTKGEKRGLRLGKLRKRR